MVTVTQKDASLYVFNSVAFGGDEILLELKKRPWGTFILGSWVRGEANYTGGGTDMEYVFRAGKAPNALYFSGGNHGNEFLDSIEFFADDGRKLCLASETYSGSFVTVVQKTRLYCDVPPESADYSDPKWNEHMSHYCETVRTYTVSGEEIRLEVDYNYVADCYLGLSYSAMFPIIKTLGLYCSFYSGETLLETVETSKVGKPDYSGPFLGKLPADRAVIWGYTEPEYKTEVRIYTPEDSCSSFRGSHKTFFWDMNKTHNKLYFSFSSLNDPELVKAGTKRHTVTTWTMLKS